MSSVIGKYKGDKPVVVADAKNVTAPATISKVQKSIDPAPPVNIASEKRNKDKEQKGDKSVTNTYADKTK